MGGVQEASPFKSDLDRGSSSLSDGRDSICGRTGRVSWIGGTLWAEGDARWNAVP